MKLSEFDFFVPDELIAQAPLQQREQSKMMVLHRSTGKIEHKRFLDLPDYLNAKDLLVFNQSKVVKARLLGTRSTGGKVEVFLLRKLSDTTFECLLKATANKKEGLEFQIAEGFDARVLGATAEPMIFVVELNAKEISVDQAIETYGHIPLPPYIRREDNQEDVSRYQTVFAKESGSVAAPTAGLHFTPEVLERIKQKGIDIDFVTLHVGLGTFQPIKTETIEEHRMHTESFSLSDSLRHKCERAKQEQRRIVAVGTTSVRALESAARGKERSTDLFLRPGEKFHWVDALFTNFHQPKSSLVVMLSTFVGSKELLFEAYNKAVEEKYRFFSYGDCMLVL